MLYKIIVGNLAMSNSQFNHDMFDFLNRLNKCSNVEMFIDVIDFEIKKIGFSCFNLFIMPNIKSLDQITLSPRMISSVHLKFPSWYINNNYYISDELLGSVIKTRFPLLISEYFIQKFTSYKCKKLYNELKTMWGMNDGIYICSEKYNYLLILNLNISIKDVQRPNSFINSKLPFAKCLLDSIHIAINESQLFDHSEIIKPLLPKISSKQLECLRLTASGLSQSQIAPKMHISIDTVKYHKKEILRIFNTNSMYFAIYKGVKLGLI